MSRDGIGMHWLRRLPSDDGIDVTGGPHLQELVTHETPRGTDRHRTQGVVGPVFGVRHRDGRKLRYGGIELVPTERRAKQTRSIEVDVAVKHHEVSLHLFAGLHRSSTGIRSPSRTAERFDIVVLPEGQIRASPRVFTRIPDVVAE